MYLIIRRLQLAIFGPMHALSAAAIGPSLLLLLLAALSNHWRSSAATDPASNQQQAIQAASTNWQQQLAEPKQTTTVRHQAASKLGVAVTAAHTPHNRIPELKGYNFSNYIDTVQLCQATSGLRHGVSQEGLLPHFKLPRGLTRRGSFSLAELTGIVRAVQPSFNLVAEPMRFTAPDTDSPASSTSKMPPLIHFTVRTKNQLQPHQVISIASWAFHNPEHSLLLFDDNDIYNFMARYFADLLPTFEGLVSQVERTDMWRYLVVCQLGGIYADSDVVAARPVADWVQDAGLLVGIENVFKTVEEAKSKSYCRTVQMVQWAIAARKGHPVVCRMGQYIADHVRREQSGEFVDTDRDHAILERTGPGIWSSSVHDYVQEHGNISIEDLVGGGKVADMRVLPQPVFGCGSSTFNPHVNALPYVYHMFIGSWKSTQPSRLVSFLGLLFRSSDAKSGAAEEGTARDERQRKAALAAAAAAAMEAAAFAQKQQVHLFMPNSGAVLPSTAAAQQQPSISSTAAFAFQHQQHRFPRPPQHVQQQARGMNTPAAQFNKMRKSQLLAALPDSAAVLEPGLPTVWRSFSTLPVVSVLALVVLLCTVFRHYWSNITLKYQWGRNGLTTRFSQSSLLQSQTHLGCLHSSLLQSQMPVGNVGWHRGG